ncbi:hypothetical protein ABEB36_014214 [Hypothenemus hampei]|uniref:Uncharacterized protein n=1 Tax=Hypothenemus hampei TaxID=57062 RepID=A0ABD1E6F9_HYPHA
MFNRKLLFRVYNDDFVALFLKKSLLVIFALDLVDVDSKVTNELMAPIIEEMEKESRNHQATARNAANVINVLAYVAINPHVSLCKEAVEIGVSIPSTEF